MNQRRFRFLSGILMGGSMIARLACADNDLVGRLVSPTPETRTEALQELDHASPEEKKRLLLGLTSALDKDPAQAPWAAAALAKIGPTAEVAVPHLIEALRADDPATIPPLLDALRKIGTPITVQSLTRALSDPNFFVRQRASQALFLFGPEARMAAPKLVELIGDAQYEVSSEAQKTLLTMPDAAVAALRSVVGSQTDGTSHKDLIAFLGRLGAPAAPTLIDVLKHDPNNFARVIAAEALGNLPGSAPASVPALIVSLENLDEAVRSAAADALGNLGASAQSAIGPLVIKMHQDPDSLAMKKEEDALTQIGPATLESLPGLLRGLRHSNLDVRRAVLSTIRDSNVSAKDAAPALSVALRDGDPSMRILAVQAAGKRLTTKAPEALSLLKQALTDNTPDVRSAVFAELSKAGPSAAGAVPEVSACLKDPSASMRLSAIQTLGQIGAASIPSLIQATQNENPTLRDAAIQAIAQMGNAAVPALQQAQQNPDPQVQKTVSELLKQIHPTEK